MEKETSVQERKHALLSASSAYRWLRCTPSAVAEDAVPDQSSDFAKEGTLAHAMGAKALKETLGMDFSAELEEMQMLKEYHTGEMDEYVAGYVEFVLSTLRCVREEAARLGTATPELAVERRLDFSDYVPDGFGTGDAVIVGARRLEIIDLKYGKGVAVDARENPQMKLYALGAVSAYDYAYDIEEVRMTIYQPRLGSVSSWSLPMADLVRWAEETVAPLAAVAVRGLGVRQSGEWCKFCRVKGSCPRLADDALRLWAFSPDAAELSPFDFASILPKLPAISDWAEAVKERALGDALAGKRIPGFKLVEGRSVRKITDPGKVAEALLENAGVENLKVWRPRELKTITELEKLVGKKAFAEIAGEWISKPKGKPTLVEESDKRKAIDPSDEFAGMETEVFEC